jgi:hypothetical protein
MPDYAGNDTVCAAHFNDEGLKEFVTGHAESTECSVCGPIGEQNIAATPSGISARL